MMAGQTISDRLLAAKHSLAGQGLAKSVCKSTTEEILGPKKKHLDYLVHCTNEPNVSIPQMANLLIERSQNTNWVVVYKALITTHHLMCYGNERFTQYLASSNTTFQLSSFIDKSTAAAATGMNPLGSRATGYDMSPFIRRYAKYINEKALSYRLNAFDFCKMKRGKEEGSLRSLQTDKLLKTLPILQSQVDALLDFDCTVNDLNNGVINMSFMLLFRDLIRLFASYNDAIINLLEKFFEMNRKQAREALELYKKFLIRMDKVAEFLKVAESVGFNRGEIPDLTKAPSSLLDALEQHLVSIEGGSVTMTTSTSQKSLKSGVTALNATGNSFGTADDSFKQQILQEEAHILNQYKTHTNTQGAMTTQSVNNPFLFDETPELMPVKPKTSNVDDILNLFDQPPRPPQPLTTTNMVSTSKGFNELVDLNNPFDAPSNTNLWSTGQSVPSSTTVPTSTVSNSTANSVPSKLITDDLESSLARLADNLTLSPSKPRGGGNATGTAVQWNSQKGVGTGNWNQSATNTYQPMNQQGTQPLFNCGLDGPQPQPQPLKEAEFDPFRNL